MTGEIKFALNHMSAPRLGTRAFLDLASSLGCTGVELRNDLADKKLTDRNFFDGEEPADMGEYARSKGLRLLGLSEAYGFNIWSAAMLDKVETLIAQAVASGAESISLIPDNSGNHGSDAARLGGLKHALAEILPMLEAADMTGLVEPLGFTTSSLRRKAETVEAIDAVGGQARFKLVHDTFHHYLASETGFFPEQTGIVHLSGVADTSLSISQMADEHRILVNENDRLGNIAQIAELVQLGYSGVFSFEPFSPDVHAFTDPEAEFARSFDFIREKVAKYAQTGAVNN